MRKLIHKHFDGIWIIDPKTRKPSVSLSFAVASIVLSSALLVASLFERLAGVPIREFDAVDVTTLTTPFLALYFGRKWTESQNPGAPGNQESPE